jgi:nucleoside-diphosphate-sugar epimerase
MVSLHLIITGATGYIGACLAATAIARGHTLTLIARTPKSEHNKTGVRQFRWTFGEPPPAEAFTKNSEFGPVDALIHLAHQWESVRSENEDENLTGTLMLANAARRAGVPRIIFSSTVSARQDALNRYGRVKWATEQIFQLEGEVSARIGLIYGGKETGQWGVLSNMVRRLPILPVPGARTLVQPIYIDDACNGLLTLAEKPTLEKSTYGLAAADPMAFSQFLKQVARHRHGQKLSVLPVPIWLALLGAGLTGLLPFIPTVDRERVLGVAGIQTMETAADLAELGISADDLVGNLVTEVASTS